MFHLGVLISLVFCVGASSKNPLVDCLLSIGCIGAEGNSYIRRGFERTFTKEKTALGGYLHAELIVDGPGDPAIAPPLAPAFPDKIQMRLQLGLEGASRHYVLAPKRCEVIPSRFPTDPKTSQVFRGECPPLLGWFGMKLGRHLKLVPRA